MRYAIVCTFAVLLTVSAAGAAEVDFARDIRPILTTNCVHCHPGAGRILAVEQLADGSAYQEYALTEKGRGLFLVIVALGSGAALARNSDSWTG